jgi:predicted RNase H-like HicB family nuclease
MRQVILSKDAISLKSSYWVVECPSLKGCASQGKTKAEALENIREAAGYIAALEEDGLPIPIDYFSALRS